MKSTGAILSIFLRTLATFRVLIGLAMLAFVGLLVFEFRERSFIWGAIGIAIVLSLKGWFALLVGSRVLRQGRRAAIGPALAWAIVLLHRPSLRRQYWRRMG